MKNNKLDLRKKLKPYYSAKQKPKVIDVSLGKFLTILGKGDPNGVRAHLEGLWWIEEGIFDLNNPATRESWRWKNMIRQPDFITNEMIEQVKQNLQKKGIPKVGEVKIETFQEVLSAQILHVGPYSQEGPTI